VWTGAGFDADDPLRWQDPFQGLPNVSSVFLSDDVVRDDDRHVACSHQDRHHRFHQRGLSRSDRSADADPWNAHYVP
jgi:hypothetical protein